MVRAILILLAIIVARPAFADPDETENKSLGFAMGLSVGGTVGGIALTAAAFAMDRPSSAAPWLASVGVTAALVMPTAGHWYARDSMRDGTVGSYCGSRAEASSCSVARCG